MNKNLLMIAAVAVGAVLVLNRAAAQVAPAGSRSAPVPSTNINNQMWTDILGGGWTALRDAQNADGTRAFLMKNQMGQTVTSDGKPVSEVWQSMLPVTYGQAPTVDVSGGDGVDWLSRLGGY